VRAISYRGDLVPGRSRTGAISYRGELVAIATRARVYLAPAVSALADGDPKLRFVAAMCLYSRDVDEGRVPDPTARGTQSSMHAASCYRTTGFGGSRD
jgi:hypothetical protein